MLPGQLADVSLPPHRGSYSLFGGSPVKLKPEKMTNIQELTMDSTPVVELVAHRFKSALNAMQRKITGLHNEPSVVPIKASYMSGSSVPLTQLPHIGTVRVAADCNWPVYMCCATLKKKLIAADQG